MNLTAKSRYAMKIMVDLAQHFDAPSRQRMSIANEQGVPLDFMDHILAKLRRYGLIESIRGRSGGYRLARSAAEISAYEILTAVEGALEPVQCLNSVEVCHNCDVCNSKFAWETVFSSVRDVLQGQTLDKLAAQTVVVDRAIVADSHVIECRGPSRVI